jgi:hypothetical protein
MQRLDAQVAKLLISNLHRAAVADTAGPTHQGEAKNRKMHFQRNWPFPMQIIVACTF